MRRVIIVKMGSTLPALISKKGDFEDWILSGMEIGKEASLVVDVGKDSLFPSFVEISGIVITGSHAMVTEHQDWSERTALWLVKAVEHEIPILGICYGHQLLAYALGGEVGDNPHGREFGTVEVHLDAEAQGDALLGGFATPIKVQVCHTQSVLRLPDRAHRLAYSEKDMNQAFTVNGRAWGLQFHPEFDVEIVRDYICHYGEALSIEGQNPSELVVQSVDTFYGAEILRRFVGLVRERRGF